MCVFLIKDEKLLEKNSEIWKKSQQHYLKTKIKS